MKNHQYQLLQQPFLTIQEFMSCFNISRATAQRLLLSDEIEFNKLGGRVIIPTKPLREKFT